MAAVAYRRLGAGGQDGRWWEAIPGFGRPRIASRAAPPTRSPRRGPRPSTICVPTRRPFRSEVMIEALEGAIQRYQRIVANGGWPAIPGTRMIRPEDDDERMPLLRQRLMISGELSRRQADRSASGYGEDLDAAVRRFQFNHGLRITGRVDKPTLQALNVPAQARLAQLRANLAAAARADGAADRGALHPGQRRRLPARGRGAPPGRAAASRDRRQARAPDALGARHHQGAQFLPLLARAGERRPRST